MKTAKEFLKDKGVKDTIFSVKHSIGSVWIAGELSKLLDEFAAQSPAIKKERLMEIMENNIFPISAYGIEGVSHAADAILSELGKPGQQDWAAVEGKGLDTKLTHWEQPAPPVTLPTDEEIETTSFRIVVDTFTAGDCPERPGIQRYVKAGMFAMRSEIENRMKGEGKKEDIGPFAIGNVIMTEESGAYNLSFTASRRLNPSELHAALRQIQFQSEFMDSFFNWEWLEKYWIDQMKAEKGGRG